MHLTYPCFSVSDELGRGWMLGIAAFKKKLVRLQKLLFEKQIQCWFKKELFRCDPRLWNREQSVFLWPLFWERGRKPAQIPRSWMPNQGEENCGGLGQEEKLKCESGNMRKLDIKEEQDLDDQKEMNQNHVSEKSYNRNSDVSEIQCHKHHK